MSRRHAASNDPTSRAALRFEGIPLLHSVLDRLSEREAMVTATFFGLADGGPVDVCKQYGLDAAGAIALIKEAIARLHSMGDSSVLGVWEDGILVDTVSTHLFIRPDSFGSLTWCPQCQKVPINTRDDDDLSKGGRQRKYCSNACRQEAYRNRKKQRRA